MSLINKIHIHIHLNNEDKLDKILEAIENRNECEFTKEIREVIKKMRASIKDLKQTPLK